MTDPHLPDGLPHSGLVSPDAWVGEAMAGDPSWIHVFTAGEVTELLAAVRAADARPMESWRREDFPLPTLADRIVGWKRDLDSGRGFVLLRGFPVADHAIETCRRVYWGLGLHFGQAISQNTDGDLLGDIRDTGEDPKAYGVRLYRTRAEQDFHTDAADIIGLFCLRAAKRGGVSRIVSSPSIVNRMLRDRPDLVPTLFSTFPFDTQGQHRPGARPWFDVPLCRMIDGRLRMFFIGWYIRESQQHPEAPRLTEAQEQVLSFIEATANDPALHLDMHFQPGDIQFLKNASVLHKRTEYEDWDEPERKRHLLRLWLVEPTFTAGDDQLRKGVSAA